MGHGTHVAGIIAGQGPKVIGVAQEATMGMYRVFGCPKNGKEPTTSDEYIIAGIEGAYKDGANIISLSLGGGGWPEDPTSVVCSNMVKKGVVVVVANGNEGDAGLFTAGSPGLGRGVISVGSIDNWNITGNALGVVSAAGTKQLLMSTPANENIPFVFDNNVPLVAVVDSTNSNLGCATINQDLKGKVALIKRGTCTFAEKAANAQTAGATGLIIYNNAPGMMSISVADPAINIPVVIITEEDGAYVLSALSSGNVTIKAPKGSVVTAPATTGGQMSDFSSYGPSPELDIAPVVSAPGGNIYSTYPLKLGGFASLSGTSMATPYISGTAALFKQAHPSYNVAQLRQALATTARPRNDAKTGKDIHPYWSGSGLVNIYDAIKSRAEFSPSALALNNTRSGPLSSIISSAMGYFPRWAVRTVTIKNTDSRKAARISFTNSAADSLTPWAADGKFNPIPRVWPTDASTQAKWDTVPQAYAPELYIDNKIRPGQSRDVTVVVIAPYGLKDSERWFYGGFLNFTMSWDGESTGASSFVVPYAGFNGNYRQLDVLAEPSEGFPLLTDLDGNVTTAAITENKPQLFSFRLELPSRVVSITLMDSAKKTLGYLPGGYLEYVSRNQQTQETLMYSVLVNGTVFKDTLMTQQVKVPAGQYQIQLNALRPLGNPKNPSDFQGWTSPAITFA
ncbi:hypothetical protein FBU59_001647 [Linderina macrospora]|uniref:Uncharacterized protein n=1 Tax=Linderina macrospora TaxID=4868 RepID=A0ACC1JDC7_9FUNG|nr:hypothetical protein FBU59_001647 [Linderina macrospora]